MLPTEPPLSLHRLLAQVPPARAQDTATATRQTPQATGPVQPQTAFVRLLAAGHDQVGNAAVAGAAAQAGPVGLPPTGVAGAARPKAVQPS
ncbi:hypothetical protein [Streptomyces roseolilacinus]|uniref:Uncharacterized protein n=1 Tax=Streptomyces roseolilacinus TaxID=66904 RepID=A0A918B2I3_9ACTN|nr:hypothetical protein [Streptomyces roseolilacinus]GGQ08609.1 hypothetical protein GCM10010249_28800 [Streptomyces roseolilacinus]